MNEQNSEPLTESQIFDLLSNERRRRIIRLLRTREDPVPLDEMVDALAAIEYDISPEDATEVQRRRIHVSITQSHLPKLESFGVVAFDTEKKLVRRGEHAETVDSFVSADGDRSPWPVYYVLLSVGAVVLLGLTALGGPVGSVVSPAVAGTIVVSSLLCLSVIHLAAVRGSS